MCDRNKRPRGHDSHPYAGELNIAALAKGRYRIRVTVIELGAKAFASRKPLSKSNNNRAKVIGGVFWRTNADQTMKESQKSFSDQPLSAKIYG
ncbi:MAG: hypothetical protein ABJC10_03655 [Acidobacteriota bacterium]